MIVSKLAVQLIDEIINATNAYSSSRYMNLRYILKNTRTPRATMMNTTEREQLTVPAAMQNAATSIVAETHGGPGV